MVNLIQNQSRHVEQNSILTRYLKPERTANVDSNPPYISCTNYVQIERKVNVYSNQQYIVCVNFTLNVVWDYEISKCVA